MPSWQMKTIVSIDFVRTACAQEESSDSRPDEKGSSFISEATA